MKVEWFKLFGGVVPIAGKDNFAVYDLDRQVAHLVPPGLYHQLELMRRRPLTELYNQGKKGENNQLRVLVEEMEHRGWGFRTTEPERFGEMPLDWFCSSHLQQAVIEYTGDHYSLSQVIQQLDNLLCRNVELRVTLGNDCEKILTSVLNLTENRSFRSVHLVVNHTDYLENVKDLFSRYHKLTRLTIYRAPQTFSQRLGNCALITSSMRSLEELSRKETTRYVINRNFFCESLRFNPYYNRKICIDDLGQIKNCLNHQRSFGNARRIALKHVIDDDSFTALWHVRPDLIRDVKDNALRYAMLLSGHPKPVVGADEYTLD